MWRPLACLAAMAIIGVTAATVTPKADAHPLPKGTSVKIGLHKICKTLRVCKDYAPRPKAACGWNNRGMQEDIYDPTLDAIVTWECRCPWGKFGTCAWFRIMYRKASVFEWTPQRKRLVWDFQRRCPAIVCKRERVAHYYPTLRYYPGPGL